jgi:3-hydroxyisobutyrate dehydrogenase
MERIGFVGLGLMGAPMALNLVRAGTPLTVWNRTPEKCEALRAAGANPAQSVDDVFARCDIVFLMLANANAVDAVLGRRSALFSQRVRGRTIVHTGTTSPGFSRDLGLDIAKAGGTYVECPVSGSRVPAERGELVAMLAGDEKDVARVTPLLKPIARETFYCGAVPNALLMKLAVNIFLITTVTGLAEAANFAQQQGLNTQVFRRIVDAGQMASSISRVKSEKIVREDFTPQAACADVLTNNDLIAESARAAHIPVPLLDNCRALFRETVELGHGSLDMAAVLLALRRESARFCER